jgi:hypothetical protein
MGTISPGDNWKWLRNSEPVRPEERLSRTLLAPLIDGDPHYPD